MQICANMSIEQMAIDFKQDYDSKEEYLFSLYISELIEHGWVDEAKYHPDSICLSEEQKGFAFVRGKKGNDMVIIPLLRAHSYQADWLIKWNDKAHGIFYWVNGGVYDKNFFPYSKKYAQNFIPFKASLYDSKKAYSIVDIKGEMIGRNNTSAITFPLNQKIAYEKGFFIQKVVVSLSEKGIFARTFTPRRVIVEEVYKVNGKTFKAGDSKLKYKATLIEKFTKK